MVNEIRASSLHRAMACVGSLSVKNVIIEEAGQAAKDGIAVGELLSEMIRQQTSKPKIGVTASNGVYLDNDMWFYANEFYETLVAKANGKHNLSTEMRIDWMTTAGVKIRGQYDVCFIKGTELHIQDLKYGFGLLEAKENWQLLAYAIGKAIGLYNTAQFIPSKIVLTIHQPRAFHDEGPTRVWEISYEELLQYREMIETMARRHAEGDRTLTTGKGCKYCPAASSCAALNHAVHSAIDTALTDWNDTEINNEDLPNYLRLLERASEVLDIKKKSMETLTISRIQNGQPVKGYSYEMTYGNRAWKSDVTPDSIKVLTGVDVMEQTMMSPNKAEKAGLSKEFTKFFTEKASRGLKLIKNDLEEEVKQVLPKPY